MPIDDAAFHVTQISPLLISAPEHPYRLVLVEGGCWQQRTAILRHVVTTWKYEYVSLGLPLSRALLTLPPREQPLLLADLVTGMLPTSIQSGVALDHIEILFSPELHTDPLRLLQSLSLDRLILAAWPGSYDGRRLSYADPANPEYYTSTDTEFLIYSLQELS